MDAIPKKNPKQILIILGILVLIELIGSINGLIHLYFYDYNIQAYTGIFKSNLSRFIAREALVYINAAIGYLTFTYLLQKKSLAGLFLLTTLILDVLFICSGLLRQIGFDNITLLTAYSNIYGIIGSGMLFLFFAANTSKNHQTISSTSRKSF
jgi:DMSO reductase anchor subunit